jgi:Ca2+-binding EF-hand superfamily protein
MRHMRMGGGFGMGGRMFEEADANRDGKVSMQEATAAAYRHFDMADVNRDGQITREERMQMHQKMRAERKPG